MDGIILDKDIGCRNGQTVVRNQILSNTTGCVIETTYSDWGTATTPAPWVIWPCKQIDTEPVILCDSWNGNQAFLISYKYDSTWTVLVPVTTLLDWVTAYTPVTPAKCV